jgi:5'-deoxynucleotidase YfbR-like HD superfamily hydrolase
MTHIVTATGRKVDPLHVTSDDFNIVDVASSLSNLCRFTGHTREFYSVAQHSLHVKWLVEDESLIAPNKATLMAALLHDASETWLNDMSTPLKYSARLAGYRHAEKLAEASIESLIHSWFPDQRVDRVAIKLADQRAFILEVLHLHPHPEMFGSPVTENLYLLDQARRDVVPRDSAEVRRLFIDTFYELLPLDPA